MYSDKGSVVTEMLHMPGWTGPCGPFTYTVLPEPYLSNELRRLSLAKTSHAGTLRVDSVTFQPSPAEENRSQDRLSITYIGNFGTLACIFDGHAGHETADFAVSALPIQISAAVANASKKDIPAILRRTIMSFDEKIASDIVTLFPEDVLPHLSIDEIAKITNDRDPKTGVGKNNQIILRGMRGTTALIVLVDKERENLWVANLGDCQAVLGTKDLENQWVAEPLSTNHNGDNPDEVSRVQREHLHDGWPEPECILNRRVLGAIAVTRALGDHTFKLKSIYASKIFLNTKPGFNVQTPVEEFIKRNHTPPYVSNEPGVEHRKIRKGTRGVGDRFIVMCSDGLTDLYKGAKDTKGLKEDERGSDAVKAASTYVRVVGAKLDESGGEENLALHLLRVGLGGDNSRSVSSGITVEMEERWMDDTTIQVLLL